MPRKTSILRVPVVLLTCMAAVAIGAQEPPSRDEAGAALRKAVDFFRTEVSTEGGYLWRYTADLARREGEGKADDRIVWVQPPGTPSVGMAYLEAYQLTGDAYYLDAARETAYALVKGQLHSGGWGYNICFDDARRAKYAYRTEPANPKGANTSTLDDNVTQAALRCLMLVDRALDFKDETIHEAVAYGLGALLKQQYPNGAWPQRFVDPPNPADFPVRKASYPEEWSRTYPNKDYRSYYTFNDNTIADVISIMFLATEVYGDPKYQAAAEKAGDFMLLAQMPDPQPGWAQQYDADMHPAWARRFEPASITGGESQGVMRTLIWLYRRTGKDKFIEPIPRALAYYKSSLRPDGKLARFYELKTNKPLYFTKDYKLTYSDADMPTHYAFIVGSSLDSIESQYNAARDSGLDARPLAEPPAKPKMTDALVQQARKAIGGLDERGAWVESGQLRYHGDDDPARKIIDCRTFINNLRALSRFVAAE